MMFSLMTLVNLKAKMYVGKALWRATWHVDSYFMGNTCPVILMLVRLSKPMYTSKMNTRMFVLVLFVVAKGSLHSQYLSWEDYLNIVPSIHKKKYYKTFKNKSDFCVSVFIRCQKVEPVLQKDRLFKCLKENGIHSQTTAHSTNIY